MKIVQINTFSYKATGSIMMNIHKKLLDLGHDSYVVWGRGRKSKSEKEIYLNDKFGVYYHGFYTRLTDKTGFASKRSTKKLLKKLDKIKPDIVHLHNLHGYYINIELLFNYLKEKKIKVIWTLHDCWSFTGHCAYFESAECEKWKNICFKCPQINEYPKSIKDNSKYNYMHKKELFTNLDMTLVTPSEWLSKLVHQSYLKDYKVKVINNGIDTDIFKVRESDFRNKNNLLNKKIILGVASEWTIRKGIQDFVELSKIVSDDVKIVLVGLNDVQIKELPDNIIKIKRTENAIKLAEIYSTADVFFNPTYEDNYPTTNLESLACGTPVVTYLTGGSIESVNEFNGVVLKKGDYKYLKDNIDKFTKLKAKMKVTSKKYDKINMINSYINLYEDIESD